MRQIAPLLDIGSAMDGLQYGERYDRVVTLSHESIHTTHFVPLEDGEHDYEQFIDAVDVVRDGMTSGERILVHCQAGGSRSVAVTTAALVAQHGWTFERAYEACRCDWKRPSEELMESARRYVEMVK